MSAPLAQPSPEAAPEPPGPFGKYRVVRKLAAGGMAQIYLAAIDGPDGFSKTCVVKRILPEYADREDFAQMFVTEAKVAALLNHPNIVQVFDFGKLGDQYYLAMEYIDGYSLNELMREAAKRGIPLGPRLAVHLAIPLCDALCYVQAATLPSGEPLKLVHRDITPGNILISKTAEVKLTDFGVVKTAVSPKATTAGVLKGKLAYMSPEQVLTKPLDHRSDLFSLGIVLFEVATGHRLWKRGSLSDLVKAVSQAQVPRPTEVCPGFPPEVERILLKALARDPEDRYQSAAEMMVDLDSFRGSQRWTSGRRELAALLGTLYPDPTRSKAPSSFSNVPPPLKSLPERGPTQAIAPDPEESDSLPAFEVVHTGDLVVASPKAARVGLEVLGLVTLALVGTAAFWLIVLS